MNPAAAAAEPHESSFEVEIGSDPVLDALRRALAGAYDVERLLGAGGMGSVYLGRDRTLDRPVAIKVITPELAVSAAVRKRFLLEARTVARLRHPNIVTVYAAGQARGALYFVMEYVPGESLRDRLTRDGTFDGDDAVTVLRDLARALAYAHGQGIVHRDVKPENVLLDATSGRAMLTDFGIAALMSGESSDDADGRATSMGHVIGSPRYMSPEQAAGDRALDGRSDLYALGLVGYEMFAGTPAVDGPSAAAIMMKHVMERPAPLASLGTRAAPGVADAITRAIEKHPDRRWPDGDALADALDRVLHPNDTTGAHAAAALRRTRRGIAAVVCLTIAAVAGYATWSMRNGPPRGVDPRKSYLVAPFAVLGPDAPQLGWLREGSVSMLTLDLAQWRDLSVVDYERGLDLQRDLKIDGARPVGLDDARRMARKAGVWTVVTGQVTGTGDSLLVDARVFDVTTGRKLDEAHQSVARGADPRPLFDALARDLLKLAGAPPVSLALTKSTTTSVTAYRHYLDGLRAMNAWQLARADTLFALATQEDSTFALAYYKRSLGLGWRDKADSLPNELLRLAARHAARLPARERTVLEAYTAFSNANDAHYAGDTTAPALFAAAQRRYLDAIAHDSGDAEAWYGLADAYYHDFAGPTLDSAAMAHWTKALAAFERTLALDPSFHLAYLHTVDMYTIAAHVGSPIVLDGTTLRLLRDPAQRERFGLARIEAGRARAEALALREGRAWVAADPVPAAYQALAGAFLAGNHFDSAAAALGRGMAHAPIAGGTTLPFERALLLTRVSPAQARAALGEALRGANVRALRDDGGADRFPLVLSSASAAAAVGDLHAVDSVAALAAAIDPTPFNSTIANRRTAALWSAMLRLALGAPATPTVRATVDAGIAAIDRQSPRLAAQSGVSSVMVPLIAYAATHEPRYLATLRRWRPPVAPKWSEVDALEALDRGDTTTARALARGFPDADSTRVAGGAVSAARWAIRAEVHAALGDARRAVAAYEVIEPARVGDGGFVEPSMALWARSLLARGRLYEQLGERAKAAASYQRFVDLWKDASPELQPQVKEAKAALWRVKDASPYVAARDDRPSRRAADGPR